MMVRIRFLLEVKSVDETSKNGQGQEDNIILLNMLENALHSH